MVTKEELNSRIVPITVVFGTGERIRQRPRKIDFSALA
jgi:hypothetical protein